MEGNGIQRDIGRLEGKIDTLTTSIGNVHKEVGGLRNDFMDMEKGRLSKLEVEVATNAAKMKVYIAIASFAASALVGLIIKFL